MTIERLDSVSYNQVSSREMMCYFNNGEIERNEAHGNVFVVYFFEEKDSNRILMNYTETTELKLYMKDKKVTKIWMPKSTGTMYPILKIPADKRYLSKFAWFDYIRPVDKYDLFEWRSKNKKNMLKATEDRILPIQDLKKIK